MRNQLRGPIHDDGIYRSKNEADEGYGDGVPDKRGDYPNRDFKTRGKSAQRLANYKLRGRTQLL